MEMSLAVFVSRDQRDHVEVIVPGAPSPLRLRGTSVARLLDDLALHLMEQVPKMEPRALSALAFNPAVELRKVNVELRLPPPPGQREPARWEGRVSVVLSQWPGEELWVAQVPRLGGEPFALARPAVLAAALARELEGLAEKGRLPAPESFVCRAFEHLEILTFEAELPTLLPSQPLRRELRKKRRKRQQEAQAEMEKGRVLVPPAALAEVARNLTHHALDGRLSRAHLREREVQDLLASLPHAGSAILLVGPPGVGKTAIVHEVVRRLAEQGGALLERQDVWEVDGNRLIAGMSVVGAWERRMTRIVEELQLRRDVLFVHDLPALVYTGRSAHGDSNVAQFLEPHLARGELRVVGECTPERLASVREEAPSFFARFRLIDVAAMSEAEALLVLVHTLREAARLEKVAADPAALEAVLALVRRFEPNRAHPGKAVALLGRVLGDHHDDTRDELGRRVVTPEAVIGHYGRHAGLPPFILWQRQARSARVVADFFAHKVVAQPDAVRAATDAVLLLEQGLNDPARPIATFLFVGPTGVGKTETAKALAELLFGAPERMFRFDMSEMMSPESVGRLFGDRWHPEGELTRRVEQQPFAVVLLDEIEKAHPAIFDALLQVLGEGRLTNAHGRTVDFASTIIVMTSNLGAREAQRALGFAPGTGGAGSYEEAARRFFRPEFFNRIDRVVPFAPLSRESLAPLAERMLERVLSRRGLSRSNVLVQVSPALVELLLAEGFDPRYGARSIQRTLEQRLAVPLAAELVRGLQQALTLVELGAVDRELTMVVRRPEVLAEEPPAAAPPSDWAGLAARRAELLARLEPVDRQLAPQARRRTALLARLNRGAALAEGEHLELEWTTALLEELARLRVDLDDFAAGHLDAEGYSERVFFQAHSLDKPFWRADGRRILVPDVRLEPSLPGALREETRQELARLEERFDLLLLRVLVPEEEVFLRFVPWGQSPAAAERCLGLAQAVAAALGRAARVQPFTRRGEELATDLLPEGAAWGLLARGPGVRTLVERERGFHLSAEDWGHSRRLLLCTVDLPEDGPASLRAPPPEELPLARTYGEGGAGAAELERLVAARVSRLVREVSGA